MLRRSERQTKKISIRKILTAAVSAMLYGNCFVVHVVFFFLLLSTTTFFVRQHLRTKTTARAIRHGKRYDVATAKHQSALPSSTAAAEGKTGCDRNTVTRLLPLVVGSAIGEYCTVIWLDYRAQAIGLIEENGEGLSGKTVAPNTIRSS